MANPTQAIAITVTVHCGCGQVEFKLRIWNIRVNSTTIVGDIKMDLDCSA